MNNDKEVVKELKAQIIELEYIIKKLKRILDEEGIIYGS
jgi:hypothetical protein